MARFSWPVAIVLALVIIAGATLLLFRTNPTTYSLVEQSETLHVDTDQLLVAPNGRRPQDLRNLWNGSAIFCSASPLALLYDKGGTGHLIAIHQDDNLVIADAGIVLVKVNARLAFGQIVVKVG